MNQQNNRLVTNCKVWSVTPTSFAISLKSIKTGKKEVRASQYFFKIETKAKEIQKTSNKFICTGGCACFTPGTLVQTINGLKPIEEIQRRDLIWSREEFGDTYAYKPVIDTTRTENQQLYEVIVENKQGETKTYLTTAEHPFYIDQIGWLKASLLEADMPLLDRNGH